MERSERHLSCWVKLATVRESVVWGKGPLSIAYMWRGTLRSHLCMLRTFCRALQDSPCSPLAVLTPRTFWSIILGHPSMIPGILAGRFKTVGIKNKQHHPPPKESKQVHKEGGIWPSKAARDVSLFDTCDIFSSLLLNPNSFLPSQPVFLKLDRDLIRHSTTEWGRGEKSQKIDIREVFPNVSQPKWFPNQMHDEARMVAVLIRVPRVKSLHTAYALCMTHVIIVHRTNGSSSKQLCSNRRLLVMNSSYFNACERFLLLNGHNRLLKESRFSIFYPHTPSYKYQLVCLCMILC